MRWLIAEDALRDRKGHWFEYLSTFVRELRALGDEVTVLADRAAEPFLVEQLKVRPVLPDSIWHRMSDGAGALRRYLRVPHHAFNTYAAVKKYLRGGQKFDVIFVPTVLVHHLLGWVWLVKGPLKKTRSQVVLFFPNTPVQLDLKTNEPSWQPAPTAKLFCRLIRHLRDEVRQGRVVLGVETQSMREALSRLTDVPFTYFPHPVHSQEIERERPKTIFNGDGNADKKQDDRPDPDSGPLSDSLTFGSYGSARHEKGSDVLVSAVDEYCRRFPGSRAKFVLQSVDGDERVWSRLKGNSKVRLIPNYFADGEYARHLAHTHALLLPYRRTSYGLRVSRVVIEAMVHGIPVVTTRGTTLADQAKEFGAAVLCEDENVDSLVEAIREMESNFYKLKARAENLKVSAQKHFSVPEFRSISAKSDFAGGQ